MVAATALKLWRRGHLQWHVLPTEFHTNLPLVQKLMGDKAYTHKHRQNGNLISLLFSLGRKVG
jgi:hypothetical protein